MPMRNLRVAFQWQNGPQLELRALNSLPLDKASAFLNKLQQAE